MPDKKAISALSSEERAITLTNRFILRNFGDRFNAGKPRKIESQVGIQYYVPIMFWNTPDKSTEVGRMLIDASTGEVIATTTNEEIRQRAKALLET